VAAHSTGAIAASSAYSARRPQLALHATQHQYIAASTHASGRSRPAAASRSSTGTPRRGLRASIAAAHTTSAMYGMSM
jgi:hypothetical protein